GAQRRTGGRTGLLTAAIAVAEEVRAVAPYPDYMSGRDVVVHQQGGVGIEIGAALIRIEIVGTKLNEGAGTQSHRVKRDVRCSRCKAPDADNGQHSARTERALRALVPCRCRMMSRCRCSRDPPQTSD